MLNPDRDWYCVEISAEGVDLQPHREAIVEAAGSEILHPRSLDFEVESDLEPGVIIDRIVEELRRAGAKEATIFVRQVTDARNVELGEYGGPRSCTRSAMRRALNGSSISYGGLGRRRAPPAGLSTE